MYRIKSVKYRLLHRKPKFTPEERVVIMNIAKGHDVATSTELNADSDLSICLRLLDFQCCSEYLKSHVEDGLTPEIALKVRDYLLYSVKANEKMDCEMPTFLTFFAMLNGPEFILERINDITTAVDSYHDND